MRSRKYRTTIRNWPPSSWRRPAIPGGEGFPKLTMFMRDPYPALTNAGEAIAAMLKNNIGVDVEIQSLDYSMYMERLGDQKKNEGGDMLFAMVPYEYDFVDGSNLLGVWGGCEDEGASHARNARPPYLVQRGVQQPGV